MKRFQGKDIIITGTSKGIGKALAAYFSEEGARVVATARSETEHTAENICFVQADIKEREKILNKASDFFGKTPDILINNAGIICYEKLIDATEEELLSVFQTNVIQTLLLSQSFARKWIAKKQRGVIVNTLSFAVTIPSVGSGIYAASKSALASLTRTMAAEWAPYGIRVNGYSPGVVETDMTKPAIEKNKASMVDAIALHEIASVEQMTKIVGFLASGDSAYLAGVNLDASGGKYIVQNAGAAWGEAE
ncbi:MAG: SDR family oxidoreductase [Lachnospiraceae bacterium]|nr:SDR family oxidoreductase [Lachnospiraceae bacterium]